MKHKLKISVADESSRYGVVACMKAKVKRGLFKKLFGLEPNQVTIIIPGDSVKGDFRGILRCGICGHLYNHKNGPYKEYWVCSTFSRMGKDECASKQIPDIQLKKAACDALGISVFNKVILDKEIKEILVMPGNELIFRFKKCDEKKIHWLDAKRSEGWTKEIRDKARERSLMQHGKSN